MACPAHPLPHLACCSLCVPRDISHVSSTSKGISKACERRHHVQRYLSQFIHSPLSLFSLTNQYNETCSTLGVRGQSRQKAQLTPSPGHNEQIPRWDTHRALLDRVAHLHHHLLSRHCHIRHLEDTLLANCLHLAACSLPLPLHRRMSRITLPSTGQTRGERSQCRHVHCVISNYIYTSLCTTSWELRHW